MDSALQRAELLPSPQSMISSNFRSSEDRVWKRVRAIKTIPLTLSRLKANVPLQVFWPYEKSGSHFTEDKAHTMTPLHIETSSGKIISIQEASRKVKQLVGKGYVMIKEDPEMGLSICEGGKLANNCITSETYLRTRK